MRQQPVNQEPGPSSLFWPSPGLPVAAAMLLVGSFFYVLLRIEPVLEYHHFGPYFLAQRGFLEPFLEQPGGLACYVGVLLAQLNYSNGLGALAFALLQGLLFVVALFCLAHVSGRAPGSLALVPPFVLLLLRDRYGCPTQVIGLGLLLALAGSAALVLLFRRRLWVFLGASVLVSALLFVLAGLWSSCVFAVLCGLFLWIRMGSWPAGLGCLVLGMVVPLLAVGTGTVDFARLLNPWPERIDALFAAALYAWVPVAGVTLALLPKPAANPTPAAAEAGRRFLTARCGQAVVVVAFLIGCGAIWGKFDRRQKLLAQVDYYTSCRQYETALAAARQLKALDRPAKVRMQSALYHTGRLAEELFSFHNMVADAPSEGVGEDCRAQSQPLFELGLINDAEHMAYEALEVEGNRPDLLRLLARINLLKDQPQAAQIFLNVLSLIPFQGERANEAWPTPAPWVPAAQQTLQTSMRGRMLTNDVVHDGLPVGRLLDVLLASNPTNQMAFEYLMADALLELDLKRIAEHLPLMDQFNYTGIPRSYAEALLLFEQVAGGHVELNGRAIRPETTERFRQFKDAARQAQLGGAADQAKMADSFGDTYWYYYFAVRSRQRAAQGQSPAP